MTACTAMQCLLAEHRSDGYKERKLSYCLFLSLTSRKLVETICIWIADFEFADHNLARLTLCLSLAALTLPVHTTGAALEDVIHVEC